MLELARRAAELPWVKVGGGYNPYRPAFTRDPYPHLDRLRDDSPVRYSPVTGSWVVSSHSLASEVMTDARYTSRRSQDTSWRTRMFYAFATISPIDTVALDNTLTNVDPDVHLRLRRAISPSLGRSHVSAIQPRIEFWVDRLLDDAGRRGGMDVVEDFAGILPILVIAEILGFAPSDAKRVKEWSDGFLFLVDPMIRGANVGRMNRAYQQFSTYIEDTLARKRADPGDDLLTRLLEHHHDGEFDRTQLRMIVMLLVIAGHEVITNLVANSVVALLRFPDQRARLLAEPGLMPTAIEELIRYESPIQAVWRIATEDIDVAGARVPQDRAVTVLIGAANNDPAQFDSPRRLDLGRTDNRHLGFALGPHYCAGPWLARIEGAAALSRLLERFPHFQGDLDRLRWKPAAGLRGLYELPLRL